MPGRLQGWGTPLYKLYRNLQRRRVWFLVVDFNRFSLTREILARVWILENRSVNGYADFRGQI